jgi:hypothetical protein
MARDASELARRLARDAEAVCRHYLPNGRRVGRYWIVGNARNAPGRSMFVRLTGPQSGPGAQGHWTDAASGEYGDLLDIIRESGGFTDFRDVVGEARRFLTLPGAAPHDGPDAARAPVRTGSPKASRRLFALSQPIHGTLVQTYLHNRAITLLAGTGALRFHPRCFYRADDHAPTETWPAMIAAVTDLSGAITGVHRTWLAPDGSGKAPVDTQKKAMGRIVGHAVRFGAVEDVLAVGEGIETMLSLRCAVPAMPMAAALSASHLPAIVLPPALRRLYIARDADAAGDMAFAALTERARAAGIEALALSPRMGDFNEDLKVLGPGELRAELEKQILPTDAVRFMRLG